MHVSQMKFVNLAEAGTALSEGGITRAAQPPAGQEGTNLRQRKNLCNVTRVHGGRGVRLRKL